MNIDFSSSQKRRTAARLHRNIDAHNAQTSAPRPTSQDCNYAVHFALPPPHSLTAASVDRILMDFQPRFRIRIPARLPVPPSTVGPAAAVHRSLTKVQREKTASDAYPHARVMNGSHIHSLRVYESLIYQPGRSVLPSISPQLRFGNMLLISAG